MLPSLSLSPCESLFSLQVGESRVPGVGIKPGPVCWHCGEPGKFLDQCNVMEVGVLVWTYCIMVSVQGCTYHALVNSGCNKTSNHQCLVQGDSLGNACLVKVVCVHGDVHEYLLVPVIIKFWGQKHTGSGS